MLVGIFFHLYFFPKSPNLYKRNNYDLQDLGKKINRILLFEDLKRKKDGFYILLWLCVLFFVGGKFFFRP